MWGKEHLIGVICPSSKSHAKVITAAEKAATCSEQIKSKLRNAPKQYIRSTYVSAWHFIGKKQIRYCINMGKVFGRGALSPALFLRKRFSFEVRFLKKQWCVQCICNFPALRVPCLETRLTVHMALLYYHVEVQFLQPAPVVESAQIS